MREFDELFTGQWGKLMEALVEGDLVALLKDRGIDVENTTTKYKGGAGGRNWEIDILAFNGREVVVVEVKTTLKVKDVDHFLAILRRIDQLLPDHVDRTKYGAVAYLKADEGSEVYAECQGPYVIRATGSSTSITNARDFKPQIFGNRVAPRPLSPWVSSASG